MGEFDTLRRACGARGVDEGQQVGRLHGLPRGLEVEGRIGGGLEAVEGDGAFRFAVDAHQVLDLRVADRLPQDGDELFLGDHHVVAGVAEHVRDLFGGQRVVDRERRRAEVDRGGVEKVEFGPVGEHEADGVPAVHAEPGESGGEAFDALRVLTPGVGDGVVGGAQRDLVGVRRGGGLEGFAEGRR